MPAISVHQAFHLAVQSHRSGNIAAAETMCRQILAVAPGHGDAAHLLGMCTLSTGRREEALQWFSQAVARSPQSAEYQCDLGTVHRLLGRAGEAERCFEKAVQIDPGLAAAWTNLSDTLLRTGRLDEAIFCGQRAVAAQPDLAAAHSNLGNALRDKGRLEEAVHHFFRALAIDPGFVEAHNNLAHAYIEMERWDDAIASDDRALALQPGFAKAWLNRGTACMGKGNAVEAEQAYRRAMACQSDYADAHWNLSIALLLRGQYTEGWREFEWRRHASVRNVLGTLQQELDTPPWDGTPIENATLLVYAEQGLGDTIQFVRYLPLVRAHSRARRVIFLCPPALAGLFPQNDEWNAEIIAPSAELEGQVLDLDQHIALLSLPLVLQRFEPLLATGPYLRTDPVKRAVWRARLGSSSRTKVGLVWKGNPQHVDDRRRSIDPRLFSPLLEVPDTDFYSLQVPAASVESASSPLNGLIDFTEYLTDFAETAALMEELDLIISVDTATAHLAGALGRPVWTLLPFAPDWRWGLGSESTPWYSTMRLFRQKTAGAWEAVVQRVVAELPSFCTAAGS